MSGSSPFDRRTFLRTGAAAVGAAALSPRIASAFSSLVGGPSVGPASWRDGVRAGEARIDILPREPIGAVTSNHYGHFIEHLGGVIYDGVWVGEKSTIPNYQGIRKALVDDLKGLTPGIARWPGGCFADSYDWQDGVGPRAQRPTRTNFWGSEMPGTVGGAPRYEPNHFGTSEFMRFCQLVGAEPSLAVNARGKTAQDFANWVDYCNAPAGTTTLAAKRAADGSTAPYNVRYWGVGNEPWGCGGVLTPEEYSEEFRRFTAWVPTYPGDKAIVTPKLVAAGPLQEQGDEAWTRRFVESLMTAGRRAEVRLPDGYSLHSYFFRRDALQFTPAGWYTLLSQPRALGAMLERQAMLLRATGAQIPLVLDEWGPWYVGGETGQTDPAHLFEQTPTLRDALVSAMMFDTFHAHADILGVATVAQTVNCIHSLFITQGEHCVRTPVYHAFALYQPHIGGKAVRTVAAAERINFMSEERKGPSVPSWVDGVSASATVHETAGQAGRVVVTVTNPRIDQPVEATIALRGVTVRSGDVTTLTHADMHARNTVAEPNTVGLSGTTPLALGSNTGTFTVTLPAASVTRIVCTLAS